MKKEQRRNIEKSNATILKIEDGEVFVRQHDYDFCMLCGEYVGFIEINHEIDDENHIRLDYSCWNCHSNVVVEFETKYVQTIITEETVEDYDAKDRRREELEKIIANAQRELNNL